jgi:hypothetical protein
VLGGVIADRALAETATQPVLQASA